MKTILDKPTRHEVISRINSLTDTSTPQWGKMNVYQMLKHCVIAEEMYLGKKAYARTFLGKIFGRIALKSMLKDETPMGKNAPTSPHFIVKEATGNVAAEKQNWVALIEEYANYDKHDFEHWFFGRMTKEQVGQFVYKHADHHLRQFNC